MVVVVRGDDGTGCLEAMVFRRMESMDVDRLEIINQ